MEKAQESFLFTQGITKRETEAWALVITGTHQELASKAKVDLAEADERQQR